MPTDSQTWLALVNQYGLPLVFMLSCFGGLGLFIVRYAWPFFTKEMWPFYLQSQREQAERLRDERTRLIVSIDQQRQDAVGALDRMRDAFSIQIESRSQELLRLTNHVGEIASAVQLLTETVQALAETVQAFTWDGAERRREKR